MDFHDSRTAFAALWDGILISKEVDMSSAAASSSAKIYSLRQWWKINNPKRLEQHEIARRA